MDSVSSSPLHRADTTAGCISSSNRRSARMQTDPGRAASMSGYVSGGPAGSDDTGTSEAEGTALFSPVECAISCPSFLLCGFKCADLLAQCGLVAQTLPSLRCVNEKLLRKV